MWWGMTTTPLPLSFLQLPASAYAIPTDNMFGYQWHLRNTATGIDLNVTGVWDDYKGSGIRVAAIDDGFDASHVDLAPNYNTGLDWDTVGNDATPTPASGDNHGTAVLGVIGADDNGSGAVGVAPDAILAGIRVGFGATGTLGQMEQAFSRMAGFDVVNNSWGYTSPFSDNFSAGWMNTMKNNLVNAVDNGRGGLGTVVVFAAGNSREYGDNTNYHNLQNSSYTIAVGALDSNGKYAYFSTPGATVLVSAPGVGITTTDVTGTAGYASGSYVSVSGTSFSAPAVSGVVALILDANERLGYRDVQEILAYSARKVDAGFADWQTNGAGNWNGTGLHFSHQYGYGLVDALAAVRLAETWDLQATYDSTRTLTVTNNSALAITDNGTSTSAINVAGDLLVDRVEITVTITHVQDGQLDIVLVSPDGTRSILADNPGNGSVGNAFTTFTFNTVAAWGENAAGTWKLEVSDRVAGTTGTLNSWSMKFLGDTVTVDNLYVFTNEFSDTRTGGYTFTDTNGGIDTINAAAVTSASNINMVAGKTGSIDGRLFSIGTTTIVENAYTGDGNDTVTGNAAANIVKTGRGNDTVYASAGNDVIYGGAGTDTYIDAAAFRHTNVANTAGDITLRNTATGDTTRLVGFEKFSFAGTVYDQAQLASLALPVASVGYTVGWAGGSAVRYSTANGSASHTAASLGLAGTDNVLGVSRNVGAITLTALKNTLNSVNVTDNDAATVVLNKFYQARTTLSGTDAKTVSVFDSQYAYVSTGAGNDALTLRGDLINAAASADYKKATFYTNEGNDTVAITDPDNYLYAYAYTGDGDDVVTVTGGVYAYINLGAGNDRAIGAAGSSYIYGLDGNDTLTGRNGIDRIWGGNHNDTIAGSGGADFLYGEAGDDTVSGGLGADTVSGGLGNDIVYGNEDNDRLTGEDGDDRLDGGTGNDTIIGGNGADTLIGGTGIDVLYGDAGNDIIYGGNDADTIYGGADNDTLYGDAGNDLVYGGTGNDTVYGSAGLDRLYGDAGSDLIYGGNDNDTIYGGADADTLYGDAGNDIIYGQTGNDTIYGGIGNDTLYGNENDDIIWGGAGDDIMYGGTGNDRLIGGAGANTFYGDAGSDTFVIDVRDSAVDKVYGFATGGSQPDRLDLSNLVSTYDPGDPIASFVNLSASGGHTTVKVSYDGAASHMTTVAVLYNVSLTNAHLASLVSSGRIVLDN